MPADDHARAPKRSTSRGVTVGARIASIATGSSARPVSIGDQPRSPWRYSTATNWKPTNEPAHSDRGEVRARHRAVRRSPSRTSGAARGARRRRTRRAPRRGGADRERLRQPASGARTTAKTASSIPVVSSSAPGQVEAAAAARAARRAG